MSMVTEGDMLTTVNGPFFLVLHFLLPRLPCPFVLNPRTLAVMGSEYVPVKIFKQNDEY